MPFISSRHFWMRLSRPLVVVLLAVLLAGGFVYLQRIKTASATASSQTGAPTPESATSVVAAGGSAAGGAATGSGNAASSGNASSGASAAPSSAALVSSTGKPQMQPLRPISVGGSTEAAKPASGSSVARGAASPAAPSAPRTTAPKPSGQPLANAPQIIKDAKAKLDAGDMLGVRTLLNDAICNDRLAAADAEQARTLQGQASNKLVFSPTPFSGDQYSEITHVDSGHGLTTIAAQHAVPWELICRINGVSDRRIRAGQELKAPMGPFHVVVSKSAYRLDLYLGGLPGDAAACYVTSFPVGLGKDDSTPTGLWHVQPKGKMKNPAWTNPRSGERYDGYDPKNPLGGYWIAIKGLDGNAVGKTSYGIHGTIEPQSIGTQSSMGCVRLKMEDIQVVYDMVSEGKSMVVIRD